MLEQVSACDREVGVADGQRVVWSDFVVVFASILAKTIGFVAVDRLVESFED